MATADLGAAFLDKIIAAGGSRTCADLEIPCDEIGYPDWPEPQSLSQQSQPDPYPLDALPLTVRMAVKEVADFVKAPLPLVASSALAAVSLATQAHADVKRAEKLIGPIGLFMLTIAESGERKSTCDSFFVKPIRDYEQAQAQAAATGLKDYEAAMAAWDAKHSGIKEKIRQLARESKETAELETVLRELEYQRPKAPRIPRLLYVDATPEALSYSLAKLWPSGGVLSAEGGIVFGSHGMGKDSVMRNLSLLNQLWDGSSLTIDRRSTESFTVVGARLTVALQVQEATLQEFLAKCGALARGTGFLARFLIAWPESTQGSRVFTEAPASWPHLNAFCERITHILNQPVPIDELGVLNPVLLPLTQEAKKAWIRFHDRIESMLGSDGEFSEVRDVASKAADNAARLAGLFQVFEHGVEAISSASFEAASDIVAWHLSESRRFLGELSLPVELVNATRLDKWLINYCKRKKTYQVRKNHARQCGPGLLRNAAALDAAITELVQLDRIRLESRPDGHFIQVNPRLVTS